MSRYTTQLRYICESLAGYEHSIGLGKIDDVLEKSVDKIFDFRYNYYDESKKRDFEKMILRHFYQEEIGLETYASWKLAFSSWFIENMDYYNTLYNSIKDNFNPLDDHAIVTGRTTQSETHATGNSDTWDLYQETPQGGLDGVKEERYLTTANHTTNNSQNDDGSTGTENVKETGRRTNPNKLFGDYLKQVKSVDSLIIKELEKFFMGLYL